MNNPGTAELALADRLRDVVAPELLDALVAGEPSAAALQEACARLRVELAAMASFLPARIVARQLAAPLPAGVRGSSWSGAVLFADLSGFTALSGQLATLGKQGAEEISAIISALFGALAEEIGTFGGELLKFGGDAVTAFFDESTLGADHAALAARAALALQGRMAQFAALQTRAGVFALQLRVGVHSGRLFAAEVGDAAHVELIVTGRNVNRVALAQEIAAPGEVVVTRETRAQIAGAQTSERQAGFFLLHDLPPIAPRPAVRPTIPVGAGDMAELRWLAERAEALRPYLPRALPRRFLADAEAGEFRPVTVLFASFASFSQALGLLADEAAAARALDAYYRRTQAVVHRYGGIVNKVDMYTYGDKLMALFGAPVAHEDDPVRAVRAALDMRGALAEANEEIGELLRAAAGGLVAFEPQFLSQRVGINTGVVFAGQVGAARRREYTVMGQPVNLAARLMSAAPNGATVISPDTRRALAGAFVLRDLAPVRLKGLPEPVPLAEVLRPAAAPEPRSAIGRAALVGRAAELERLTDEARAALAGAGRVLALVGEAGTGKTRLIEELLRRLIELSARQGLPPFMLFTTECQSYELDAPYAAAQPLLQQMLGLAGPDEAHDPAAVTRRTAALAPELARFTPLLGDLLGAPLDETPLTAALTPEQRHSRAQELVEALVLAEAQAHPLVLVVDDLQWSDASSRELIARLARLAGRTRLLLLLGYRRDAGLSEPWLDLPHCAALPIGELNHDEAVALLGALLHGAPPPALAELAERAQGNPFFVEELVRGLVEAQVLRREGETWQITGELDAAAVPGSVEGIITARLDRLEEQSREVVQVAAVIGRRFALPVLAGVAPHDAPLADSLGRLEAADLVQPDREEGERVAAAYLFKHALTREVAYEAILYARRRELHRRVAEATEQLYASRLDDHLALLARHWLLAEAWPRAFDYHLRAGRQAQQRYANHEAIALFERALEIVGRLTPGDMAPPGAARDGQPAPPPLLELNERLGTVLALIGEYDAALARHESALRHARAAEMPLDSILRLHRQIARVFEKRADFDLAFAWVERALALAGGAASEELTRCELLGAGLHQRQGRFQQALEWGERALDTARRIGDERDQAEAYMLLGGTYASLGDNQRAHDLTARCLRLYEAANDLPRLADAHNNLALFSQELGRLAEATEHYRAGAEIKAAIGDVYGQAMIANNLGLLLAIQGQLDEATAQYARSLEMFERLGSRYATGVLHMNLGAAELLRGRLASAEEHLAQSAALYAQAGAEDLLPELERYQAELHLKRGEPALARARAEQALGTAVRLAARAEEGMTRRTLGRSLALLGEQAAAWDELQQSLAILREAGVPLETARTLVAVAALALDLGRVGEGRAALDEGCATLESIGARHDLAETAALRARFEAADARR